MSYFNSGKYANKQYYLVYKFFKKIDITPNNEKLNSWTELQIVKDYFVCELRYALFSHSGQFICSLIIYKFLKKGE